MKIIKIILLLSVSLLLTSCYDSQQPENLLYSYSIGIDYADDEYTLYLQVINLAYSAKGESTSGSNKDYPSEVTIVKGRNLSDALFNIYDSSQQPIYWSNTSYIIMTDRLLREKGVEDIVEIFKRTPKTRYHMMLYVTKEYDNMADLFTLGSILNMSSAFTNIALPNQLVKQFIYLPIKDLREFLRYLDEPPYQVTLPIITLNDTRWKNQDGPREVRMFDGVAHYDKKKFLLGETSLDDSRGLSWIQNKIGRSHVSIEYKHENSQLDEVNLISVIVNNIKTKIIPTLDNGKLKFYVKVNGTGVLNVMNEDISLNKLEKDANEIIKKEIMKTYEDALKYDVDVYNLNYVLYTKYYKFWNEHTVEGHVPLDKDSLVIETDIRIEKSGVKTYYPTIETTY